MFRLFSKAKRLVKVLVFLSAWDASKSLTVQISEPGEKRPLVRNLLGIFRSVLYPRLRSLSQRNLRELRATLAKLATGSPREVLVVWGTINQMRALESIAAGLEDRALALSLSRVAKSAKVSSNELLIGQLAGLISLFTSGLAILVAVQKLYQMKCLGRQSAVLFTVLFSILPYVLAWFWVLRAARPKIVLMANDHSDSFVALILACRFLGVRTAYTQHAHVTSRFPPLSVDFAFLDGESAARTYGQGEDATKIFLTGSPRLAVASGKLPPCGVVGVALSLHDKQEVAFALAGELEALGCAVVIRLHPRHSEKVLAATTEFVLSAKNTTASFASVDTPERFLSEISVLLASNSSIHLEAALMNRKSFYTDLGSIRHDKQSDYYGFLSGGLIAAGDNMEIVANAAQFPASTAVDPRVLEYYCAQTENSAQEICSLIQHYLDGGDGFVPGWQWVEGLGYKKASYKSGDGPRR